ncbi:MAG: class B sortase [Clostridia bacterium]|nr:class B sortase [Clostridia bacterium]
MKKLFCALLALTLLLPLGACGTPEPQDLNNSPSNTAGQPTAAPTPEPVPSPAYAYPTGEIAAHGDSLLVLRSDGIVNELSGGSKYVTDLYNVGDIVSNGSVALGVTVTGAVLSFGEDSGYEAIDEWTGICAAALGDGFAAALNTDGALLVCGPDSAALNCSGVDGVVALAAHGANLAVIRQDGSIAIYGAAAALTASLAEVADARGIAISDEHIAIRTATGGVLAFALDGSSTDALAQCATSGMADAVKVIAADGVTIAISADGGVQTAPHNDILAAVTDAAEIAQLDDGGYAIVSKSGSLTVLNAQGEADVEYDVQLRPVALPGEDNLIEGIMPGSDDEAAAALIGDALGLSNVALSNVSTGAQIITGGTVYGTLVIHGDVTGDGVIALADADYLEDEDPASIDNPAVAAAAVVNGKTGAEAAVQVRTYLLRGDPISQFTEPVIDSTHIGDETIVLDSYEAALSVNPDVVGFITVPGTNINYPILYGDDWFYNDHDIYGRSSNAGSIYSYYNTLGKNNTITGHNMRQSGTMFHALHEIQENAQQLLTRENRIWTINLFGRNSRWEVFALYEVEHDEPANTLFYNTQLLSASNDEATAEWIAYQLSRSEIDLGVTPTARDTFVTLVTCGDAYDYATAQSRLYIFLKRLS